MGTRSGASRATAAKNKQRARAEAVANHDHKQYARFAALHCKRPEGQSKCRWTDGGSRDYSGGKYVTNLDGSFSWSGVVVATSTSYLDAQEQNYVPNTGGRGHGRVDNPCHPNGEYKARRPARG